MTSKELFKLFRESNEPSFIKFLEKLEKDGVDYSNKENDE